MKNNLNKSLQNKEGIVNFNNVDNILDKMNNDLGNNHSIDINIQGSKINISLDFDFEQARQLLNHDKMNFTYTMQLINPIGEIINEKIFEGKGNQPYFELESFLQEMNIGKTGVDYIIQNDINFKEHIYHNLPKFLQKDLSSYKDINLSSLALHSIIYENLVKLDLNNIENEYKRAKNLIIPKGKVWNYENEDDFNQFLEYSQLKIIEYIIDGKYNDIHAGDIINHGRLKLESGYHVEVDGATSGEDSSILFSIVDKKIDKDSKIYETQLTTESLIKEFHILNEYNFTDLIIEFLGSISEFERVKKTYYS